MYDMGINKRINTIAKELFNDNNVRFAETMDTSEANIRNYRSKTIPKIDFIIKLHEKLEISFEWILLNRGEMKKSSYVKEKDPLTIAAEQQLDYLITTKDEIIKAFKQSIKSQEVTIKSQEKTIQSLEMLIDQLKSSKADNSHTPTRTIQS